MGSRRASLLLCVALGGCGCGDDSGQASDGSVDAGVDAGLDAGRDAGGADDAGPRDAGFDDAGPDAARDAGPNPAGWTPLPGLPDGCTIQRAEHPEVLFTPAWESCGEGCERLVQDPALPVVFDRKVGGHDGDRGYIEALARDPVDRGRIAVMAATEGAPLGAWKGPPFDGEHLCDFGAAAISETAAAFSLMIGGGGRPYEERIYQGPLGDIGGVTEPLAVVDETWLSGTAIQRLAVSDTTVAGEVGGADFLVAAEAGGLSMVRSPGGLGRPQKPQLVGRTIYWDDQAARNRIARATRTDTSSYYFEAASADVRAPKIADGWVAWQQASPADGPPYTLVELWASPLAEDPADLAPQRLVTLSGFHGGFAMGGGIYGVFEDYDEIDLYDLADGRKRVFHVPSGYRVVDPPTYITADEMLVVGFDTEQYTLFRVQLASLPYE